MPNSSALDLMADITARAIVIPAEGPSFGVAPSGRCICIYVFF